jgi:uncharacterized membrane protein YeaQ/YmgE (transglycosylase-associated protein family)
MAWLGMIIAGLIAGLLASWVMKARTGIIVDLILGLVGALIGGWLSSLLFGADLTTGLNLTTILVAFVGAVIVIAIYRALRREPV